MTENELAPFARDWLVEHFLFMQNALSGAFIPAPIFPPLPILPRVNAKCRRLP